MGDVHLVTGGAGFIGSHLVEALAERGYEVVVVDNLSSGKREYVSSAELFVLDVVRDVEELARIVERFDVSCVWHLAAEPNVRNKNAEEHFRNNLLSTKTLLDVCVRHGIDTFVLASTSTIYGEAKVKPTPENYGELKPISYYGATKLAAEALVSGYSFENDINSFIFRLANIIGERLTHGVIYDFFMKLKKNREVLEILGDGTQRKSYLSVKDCVDAMLLAFEKVREKVAIFNVGSREWISVREIADIVCDELNVRPRYVFKDVVGDGRGWVGDVKEMLLDTTRIERLGWRQKVSVEEAIRRCVRWLVSSFKFP